MIQEPGHAQILPVWQPRGETLPDETLPVRRCQSTRVKSPVPLLFSRDDQESTSAPDVSYGSRWAAAAHLQACARLRDGTRANPGQLAY
jgi:hypothetical protein